MPEGNVDAFMAAVGAWNRGDVNDYVACFHPDGKWEPGLVRVEGGGPITGRDEIAKAWIEIRDGFKTLTGSFDEVRDLGGDLVLGIGRLRGTSVGGVPIDSEYAVLAEYRDGLIVHGRTFTSHAEALEAATGLG
jgi:ketosteroid isomerase-like protein